MNDNLISLMQIATASVPTGIITLLTYWAVKAYGRHEARQKELNAAVQRMRERKAEEERRANACYYYAPSSSTSSAAKPAPQAEDTEKKKEISASELLLYGAIGYCGAQIGNAMNRHGL